MISAVVDDDEAVFTGYMGAARQRLAETEAESVNRIGSGQS